MTSTTVEPQRKAAPTPPAGGAPVRARRNTAKMGWQIALYALLIVIALIYIYPFLVQVSTSFKTDAEAAVSPVSLIPQVWSTAAYERLFLRSDVLEFFTALNGYRDALLKMPQGNADAILPAYTWGVQAQPITFGHYLSGYATAFERTATRMREAYVRLNASPLGAAALGTSAGSALICRLP